MSRDRNPFERVAREAKVRAIMDAYDWVCIGSDIDPYKRGAFVAMQLRRLSQEDWRRLSLVAGKKPASLETQRAVIEAYERRQRRLEERRAS